MKKIIFGLVLAFGLFTFSFAEGQVRLSVSPQKFDMTVLPGGSQSGQVRLRNDSNRPLPISVETTPFSAEDQSGRMSFEGKRSVADWISFEEREFILRPGEDKRLSFEVKTPSDVSPGGYYLFTYFQTEASSREETGTRVVPAVGIPFLISTGDLGLSTDELTDKEPEVVNFSIEDQFRIPFLERQLQRFIAFAADEPSFYVTKTMPGKFLVTIKNNDLYHIRPEGDLTIYKEGEKLATGFLEGETILPGKSRTFEVEVDEDLSGLTALGNYKATLDLESGGVLAEDQKKVSLSFLNLPSYLFLLVGLLFGFILLRKRIALVVKFAFGS